MSVRTGGVQEHLGAARAGVQRQRARVRRRVRARVRLQRVALREALRARAALVRTLLCGQYCILMLDRLFVRKLAQLPNFRHYIYLRILYIYTIIHI